MIFDRGMRSAQLPQYLDPFRVWHHHVRDHQVRAGPPKEVEPSGIARFDDRVANMLQNSAQRGADGVVVVDEEDSSHT